MSQFTLLRYNFRIMMLNNRWLVAFPIVVSQLSVFWLLVTRQFTLDLPAQSVEVVTPLLGAFLGAHLLSAEYRSRVGALLACRPVNIGRIVVLRLLVVLTVVWGLAMISLLAYTYGKQPFDMTPPILASIPSTLFLTMLAMTFATLFRHSLAGFAVAAIYWVMDLMPGPPIQPYMSLRTLTYYFTVQADPGKQTFVKEWWISKVVLLVGALILYILHARVVFALGSPQTVRRRRQAMTAAITLIAVYLVSGALLRVVYGYSNRGKLVPSDVGWFRHQFAPYGPIPVAALFGPDFSRFVGEVPNPWRMPEGNEPDVVGDTAKHRKDLQDVISRSPNSLWAPSAADALARLEVRRVTKVEDIVAYYKIITDRYRDSPYVDYALERTARAYIDAGRPAEAEAVFIDLVKRVPNSIYVTEALRFLVQSSQASGRQDEAIKWATQWTTLSPIEDRFDAWIALAQFLKARGDDAQAKQAAEKALKSVSEFRTALHDGSVNYMPKKRNDRQRAADLADLTARGLL